MIVRQRQIIDRAHDDLSVLDDRPLLRRMHAKDCGLRRIDDRRRQHRAEHTAVGDRERAAGQFLELQLALAGALAEIGDFLLDVGERLLVRIAQDRHDEAARGTDGDTDVEEAVIDDVGAVDRCVDDRVLLQSLHRSLDEERHEAELHAVLLLEPVLVPVAQVHHRLHVHFVERRQDRRGRLRLDETLGDALPQARHRDALLGTRGEAGIDVHARGRHRLQCGRRSGWHRGCRGYATAFDGVHHIALGHAAATTGASDARRVDALIGHHLPRSRQRSDVGSGQRGLRGGGRFRRRCCGRGGGGRRCSCGRRGGGRRCSRGHR